MKQTLKGCESFQPMVANLVVHVGGETPFSESFVKGISLCKYVGYVE